MPVFNVVGVNEKSGRARRKSYKGFDAEEVKAVALQRDGLVAGEISVAVVLAPNDLVVFDVSDLSARRIARL